MDKTASRLIGCKVQRLGALLGEQASVDPALQPPTRREATSALSGPGTPTSSAPLVARELLLSDLLVHLYIILPYFFANHKAMDLNTKAVTISIMWVACAGVSIMLGNTLPLVFAVVGTAFV